MNNTEINFDTALLDGALFTRMVRAGSANLRLNAGEVNELNVFPVPDGDTGDNMSMTAEGGVASLDRSSDESCSLADAAGALSRGMLLSARGNSGVILSQMFAGMARGLEGRESADVETVCAALKLGVKQAYAAVMKPAEGTILTVAREGVENAISSLPDSCSIGELFSRVLDEMRASLERTPELLPVLKEAGVVDSGGAGLVYIFDGFVRALRGEKIDVAPPAAAAAGAVDLSAFGPDSVMTYGYCTELLLQLQSCKVDVDSFDPSVITEFLEGIGNSIVAFKTESVVKLHVHTMTPERVLEFCRKFGEFLTVKIENMSVQHSELSADPDNKSADTAVDEAEKERLAREEAHRERRPIGFIAVASGSGLEKLFFDLGADCVVDGGQTKNPSISDFIEAFDKTNADHIFVLPNNGNIILAASQAAELYTDSVIHVIPSRDIGSGYVALSSRDATESDPELIERTLTEAMEDVTTGSVSVAVRDANLNGVSITEGNYIGFVGKQMLVSTPSISETVCALADRMLEDGEKFMLTAFIGADASADDCAALEAHISEQHPDIELYLADGAQDVYPFILVAEG